MNINFIFDFDSTLVETESLNDILNISLNNDFEKKKEIEKITKLAMEGKITFKESLETRLKLASIHKDTIDEVIGNIISNITENMESVISNIQKYENTNIYIVSGGFTEIIKPVADILNIQSDNIFANKFIFDKQNNVEGVEDSLLLQEAGKAKTIEYCKKMKIISGKSMMIGDGYTDLETYLTNAVDDFVCFCGIVSRGNVENLAPHIANNVKELECICINFIENNCI